MRFIGLMTKKGKKMKINFESDVSFFCSVCGQKVDAKYEETFRKTVLINPCDICIKNVSKVHEVIRQIKMIE